MNIMRRSLQKFKVRNVPEPKDSESYISTHEMACDVIEKPKEEVDPEVASQTTSFESPIDQPWYYKVLRTCKKFAGFIGPSLLISQAYFDPGNFSTDITGGSLFRYKMLFVILLSTVFALYLQTLAIRLGTATGRDLAEACHDHMHKYVSFTFWILAEATIMATDVAEVAGSAIALKVLGNVPLMGGVFITIADVFLVILVYGRENGMKALRLIEYTIGAMVFVTFVCFCVILAKIPSQNVGTVLYGYVPSSVLVTSSGIYAAAGIIGATVMPHSLYLGSAQAIPRVRRHDLKCGYMPKGNTVSDIEEYRPSVAAFKATIRYSVVELYLALITLALFTNSAILIIAGDTMYNMDGIDSATLFDLYTIMSDILNKGIAKLFFVALLVSGLSSSIICTIAGQIVSEGHIKWRTWPWLRRLVTRVVTLIPCVVTVATMGEKGISDALNFSQVVLTITLPFLAAALVYLTSRKDVMRMKVERYHRNREPDFREEGHDEANGWISTIFGTLLCIFITVANVYNLVELGQSGVPG